MMYSYDYAYARTMNMDCFSSMKESFIRSIDVDVVEDETESVVQNKRYPST